MITKIEVNGADVTFYFHDSDTPWSILEFVPRGWTPRKLRKIQKAILRYNTPVFKKK